MTSATGWASARRSRAASTQVFFFWATSAAKDTPDGRCDCHPVATLRGVAAQATRSRRPCPCGIVEAPPPLHRVVASARASLDGGRGLSGVLPVLRAEPVPERGTPVQARLLPLVVSEPGKLELKVATVAPGQLSVTVVRLPGIGNSPGPFAAHFLARIPMGSFIGYFPRFLRGPLLH